MTPTRPGGALVLAPVLALVALVGPAAAPPSGGDETLVPSQAVVGAAVGRAVALHGDLAALAAPDDEGAAGGSGSVTLFVRQTRRWSEAARLVGPPGVSGFGQALALHRRTLLVGAPFDPAEGSGSGAAYLFTPGDDGTHQRTRFTPDDAAAGQEFGVSVALDGSTAVVGAWLDAERAPAAGAAYVFHRQGSRWHQSARLTASDASVAAFFGASVDLHGDTVVVGAPGAEAAYVFVRQGEAWLEQDRLAAPEAGTARFGQAVAVHRKTVLVGAPHDDGIAPRAGAAHLFERLGTSWVHRVKLRAQDAGAEDEFGSAVDLRHQVLAVGAPFEGPSNAGAAYLLRGTELAPFPGGWLVDKLVAPEEPGAFFGAALSLGVDELLVGAPSFADVSGRCCPGAGHVLDLTGAP